MPHHSDWRLKFSGLLGWTWTELLIDGASSDEVIEGYLATGFRIPNPAGGLRRMKLSYSSGGISFQSWNTHPNPKLNWPQHIYSSLLRTGRTPVCGSTLGFAPPPLILPTCHSSPNAPLSGDTWGHAPSSPQCRCNPCNSVVATSIRQHIEMRHACIHQ